METVFCNPEFIRGYQTADDLIGFFKAPPHGGIMAGVALIGRSNVGKSSLINALFNHKIAHVSNTPGRTQQINIFTFQLRSLADKAAGTPSQLIDKIYYCFDLPGYGHADVSKEMKKRWQELMNAFFQQVPDAVSLINIQDARHPFTDADQLFFEYLKSHKKRPILVLNKLDKLKTQRERAQLENSRTEIMQQAKSAKQVYYTSVEKNKGIEELHRALATSLMAFN